jgi:NADH-quinone oxidoreductase subunit J
VSVEQIFFYPLALLCVVGAVGVVVVRNPLHGALWLVCSFFFLSAIYFLLGAQFVGILQLIVYAGAIMVLFLFVIMLLALSETELGERRVTIFKVLGASASLFGLVLAGEFLFKTSPQALPVVPRGFGTVALVGQEIFREHPLQFESVSLLLLVAIAGAVVVAKGKI